MRIAVVIGLLFFVANINSQTLPKTYLFNPKDLNDVKQRVLNKDPTLMPSVQVIDASAKAWLTQGPWTVTSKTYLPPSGDKHDYMSLDKYYWPCTWNPPNDTIKAADVCNTTTGLPYVHHDGYTNPEEHLYDYDAAVNTTLAVTELGYAYYFTNNNAYVQHAVQLLQVFFVNNDTKMNPNLNFGHFIPGVVNGSHGGVIDFHFLPEMLDSIALMRLSSSWPKSLDQGLKPWFQAYLHWLRNSTLGKEEMGTNNNHGVWYDVQCGYISLHYGENSTAEKIAAEAVQKRIMSQILANGELPFEEFRTKSWSYSEFCLDAFFHLATFSTYTTTNLWTAVNSRIRLALDFQLPYIEQKLQWPFPQIVPFISNCTITHDNQCIGSYFNLLRIAANTFNNSTYESVICKLPGINCQANLINLLYEKKQTKPIIN
jgi:hypothetical protein